jgi:cell division protein FtsQ
LKPPRKSPRRQKKSPAARLRPFRVLFAFAALLLAGAIAALVTWPGFSPRDVVVSGNRIVPTAEILQRAAIAPHVNMWLQDPRAIASRVESIAYVDTASVRRIPPVTMRIAVTERTPFALLRSGSSAAIVDRSLRVLALAATSDPSDLPVLTANSGVPLVVGSSVTDPAVTNLRDDYLAMVDAHVIPVALRLDRYGGLIAVVRGGVQVLLGDGDLEKKLPLVDPILAQIASKQRRVAAIDLRAPGTPVLVYR